MKNTELEKIHNNPLIPSRLNDLVTEVLDFHELEKIKNEQLALSNN